MAKDNDKDAIASRFILIFEELLRDGTIKNRTQFAKSIGEHLQNLAKIENGSRWPTLDQVARTCELYGYSPTWLILNLGPKKIKETEQLPLEERITILEIEVGRIRRALRKKAG